MSRKSRKNKLSCEGQNFNIFTSKNDKGTIYVGFDAAKRKHITITHDEDGISSHLTTTNELNSSSKVHKHLVKVSPEEARKKLSFEGRIVKVDPEWKLWYPKENIRSSCTMVLLRHPYASMGSQNNRDF